MEIGFHDDPQPKLSFSFARSNTESILTQPVRHSWLALRSMVPEGRLGPRRTRRSTQHVATNQLPHLMKLEESGPELPRPKPNRADGTVPKNLATLSRRLSQIEIFAGVMKHRAKRRCLQYGSQLV